MVKKDRLVKTFLELVQIDSPTGEEKVVAQFLAKKLKGLGARSVEFDSYGNLIAKFDGEGEPFLLNAHMDTVEPGRGIKPIIVGDIIKTDGSTILGGDPKAGVSAILEALISIKEERGKHISLEVVFTRSEEQGLAGACNLDYTKVASKRGITVDGEEEVYKLFINGPGYNQVDLTVIGRSAHAGVEPENGISAIKIASDIISQLKLGRIDFETTANIGLIEGGSARNAVPEKVIIKGEIRSRDNQKLEAHTKHFREVCDKVQKIYPEAKLGVDITRKFDPYALEKDNPVIQFISGALKEMGLEPDLMDSGGGTDAHIFHSNGIESIVVGAGDAMAHTTREYVVISQMLEAAKFIEKLIKT